MEYGRFLILLALAEGPAHGAAVSSQIVGDTVGRGYIRRTSFYDELAKLEHGGLVRCTGVRGRRKVFELSPKGRVALMNETKLLRMVLETAGRRTGV